MRKQEKILMTLAIIFAFSFALPFTANAMHIMEGYLPVGHVIAWSLISLPFLIAGIIVLIFQALLLAHGGFTTLGANTFSMAIAGPFVSFIVYKICKKSKVNDNVSIFLAAFIGDLLTYVVTAFQLAFAYPMKDGGVMASAGKFLLVFAPTQVPLAIIEGMLTVIIVIGLKTYAQPELKEIGFIEGGNN